MVPDPLVEVASTLFPRSELLLEVMIIICSLSLIVRSLG